jgi:hypothetical protein
VKERGVLNATVVISGEEPRTSAPAVAAPRAAPPAQPYGAQQPGYPPQRAVRSAPQYGYDPEPVDPRVARSPYRQPGYPQPYPRGYYPPPPPGYYYAPQQAPQGYYYYYR